MPPLHVTISVTGTEELLADLRQLEQTYVQAVQEGLRAEGIRAVIPDLTTFRSVVDLHDPLPIDDDLALGLTCCGRVYPTFALYMQHRRTHREG